MGSVLSAYGQKMVLKKIIEPELLNILELLSDTIRTIVECKFAFRDKGENCLNKNNKSVLIYCIPNQPRWLTFYWIG